MAQRKYYLKIAKGADQAKPFHLYARTAFGSMFLQAFAAREDALVAARTLLTND